MLETLRNQHREQLNPIGSLQGDLENLKEVNTVSEDKLNWEKKKLIFFKTKMIYYNPKFKKNVKTCKTS